MLETLEQRKEVETFTNRLNALKRLRFNWDAIYRDIQTYVAPNRGSFLLSDQTKGRRRASDIWDSTAPNAVVLSSSGLSSYLTSMTERWFSLAPTDLAMKKNRQLKKTLYELENYLYDNVFDTNLTNFNSMAHELYLDIMSYGTAIMYIDGTPGSPISFKTLDLSQCYICEDANGMIDTVYRTFKIEGKKLLELWRDRLPANLVKKAELDFYDANYSILHCVEPASSYSGTGLKTPPRFPYRSVWILQNPEIVLEESGFDSFPYVVPRWSKRSDEVYGTSPTIDNLPSIKVLNVLMKSIVKNTKKVVDPPLMVPYNTFLGNINTSPGSVLFYQSGTNDKITPLETGTRLDVSIELVRMMQDDIRKSFFLDQMRLSDKLPQMTATEVAKRNEDELKTMSPHIARLESEFLYPMLRRVVSLVIGRGEVPDAARLLKDTKVKVDYVGPVTRAQKATQLFNVQRWFESMSLVAPSHPQIVDLINSDGYATWAHELLMLPEVLLNTDEVVGSVRAQRAQANAQAAQLQQQHLQGEQTMNMSKAISNMKG